jgi:curved DNA-binding protein CbpA
MNYYQILGVDKNAEFIVIKSAYKTLIQKYHPDKAKTPKEAESFLLKTKELNEAYSTLSDDKSRSAYDEKLNSYNTRENQAKSNKKDDNWETTVEYFPDLKPLYDDLNKISNLLANEFKETVLKSKDFKNIHKIHKKLKDQHLLEMFGNKKENQAFGRWLLLNNKKEIALELNKVINLLGFDIDYNKVIFDLSKKHDLDYGLYKVEKEIARKKEAEIKRKNKRYEDELFNPTQTLPEKNTGYFFIAFLIFLFIFLKKISN